VRAIPGVAERLRAASRFPFEKLCWLSLKWRGDVSVSEDSAPSGRGFSRHEDLSSDACLDAQREKINSRADSHRLDESYQVADQKNCASLSLEGELRCVHVKD
jgi:hypothetical protein